MQVCVVCQEEAVSLKAQVEYLTGSGNEQRQEWVKRASKEAPGGRRKADSEGLWNAELAVCHDDHTQPQKGCCCLLHFLTS